MAIENDYHSIPQIALAIGRAALRRATYRATGQDLSANTVTSVIDRLLDRRLELMPAPVAPAAPPAGGVR